MSDPIRIIATIVIKSEYIDTIRPLLLGLIGPSRKDEGNHRYELQQEIGRNDTFIFFEEWASQQAIESHEKAAHFQNFIKQSEGKLASLDIKLTCQIG